MANNLRSMVKVIANEEAIANLESRLGTCGYSDVTKFATSFFDEVGLTEDGSGVLNVWSTDNLGSKWNYLSDNWGDGEFVMESAWYAPKEFFIHLYKLMSAIDPEAVVEVRYEDETYNPIGAFVVKKDSEGNPMYYHEEDDEMEDPTVDMDWDDEGYDDAQMEFMDSIGDRQDEMLQFCHQSIDDNDGEPIE